MLSMTVVVISNGLNINFIKLTHPMSMMMFIIFQTILIGLTTGTLMESFWSFYILFLTFLGGMLVLFMCITNIASNEMFYPKSINMMITLTMCIIMSIIFIISDKIMLMHLFKNSETLNINKTINFQEMSSSLEKLYNKPYLL